MRLEYLHLLRYGHFSDRELPLPAAERDFHLIIGPNEAGKSTVCEAVQDVLYGFRKTTSRAFLHPMPELRLGACLAHSGPAAADAGGPQRLAFIRTKGNKNTVRSPADVPLADDSLLPFLGRSDRDFFVQMFGLDHSRLVQGGHSLLSASDNLGQILFQSAAGIARLGAVREALEAEADQLWARRKSGSRAYYLAADAFDRASAALKTATVRPRDWAEQRSQLERLREEQAVQRRQLEALRSRRVLLERLRRSAPLLQRLDALAAQQAGLGPVTPLPVDAAQTLAQASQARASARLQANQAQRQQAQAQAALAALVLDEPVLAVQADITALNEARLQYRAHRGDIAQRQAEVDALWSTVPRLADQLGWVVADEAQVQALLPPLALRATLERLSRDHAASQQALHHAQQQVQTRQTELAQCQAALAGLPAQELPPELAAAVAQAHALGDFDRQRHSLHLRHQQAQARVHTTLAALHPWPLPLPALRAMTVPAQASLNSFGQEALADAAERRSTQAQADTLAAQVDQLALAVQHYQATHQPVTEQALAQARQQRDALWAGLQTAPAADWPAQAQRFEQALHRTDTLADARHATAQQASELLAREQQLAQRRLELAHAQAQLARLTQAEGQRQHRWAALAAECGLPPLPAEAAPHWLACRSEALAADDALAHAAQELAAWDQHCAQVAQALAQALGAVAGDSPPSALPALPALPMLPVLMRRAEDQLHAITEARGQRRSLGQQLAQAQPALALAEQRLAQAQQQMAQWQRAWDQALTQAGLPGGSDPSCVQTALAQMQQIDQALQAMRQIRQERIATMQADLDRHAQAVRQLAAQLPPATDAAQALADDPDRLTQHWVTRLEQARRVAAEAQRQQQALDAATQALAQASDALREAHARLAPLVWCLGDAVALADMAPPAVAAAATAAPQPDPDDSHDGGDGGDGGDSGDRSDDPDDRLHATLAAAIARSDQQRQLSQQQEETLQALREAGDGLDVAALRREAATVEPGAARAELDSLLAQEQARVDLLARLAAQEQACHSALAAVTGSADAVQAEGQRQEALAQMADAVERYLKVHTAARLLRWSIEQYREMRQGPMLQRASEIFRRLTLGSFERLAVDFDTEPPRLQGRRADGSVVAIDGLSEGSRDQLYLALRLAALDLHLRPDHAAPDPALPFIADDLFINYDDARAAAGLAALGELSRHTQVLFLTHHDHLLPVVRQVFGDGVNVLRL